MDEIEIHHVEGISLAKARRTKAQEPETRDLTGCTSVVSALPHVPNSALPSVTRPTASSFRLTHSGQPRQEVYPWQWVPPRVCRGLQFLAFTDVRSSEGSPDVDWPPENLLRPGPWFSGMNLGSELLLSCNSPHLSLRSPSERDWSSALASASETVVQTPSAEVSGAPSPCFDVSVPLTWDWSLALHPIKGYTFSFPP